MANIKSAKKRILVNASNAEENKSVKSRISTYTKKFKAAVEAKNVEEAKKAYSDVTAVLDNAVKKMLFTQTAQQEEKQDLQKHLKASMHN